MIGKFVASTSTPRRHRAGRLAVLALAATAMAVPAISSSTASAAVNRAPIGHFDSAVVHGSTITVSGWAADPDYPHNSIAVRGVFTPNLLGKSGGTNFTNISHDPRPDVAKAHPEFGPNHGFSFTVDTFQAGTSKLCMYGVDFKPGPDGPLGCLTVTVAKNRPPFGHLDAVTAKGNDHVEIKGWAADLDTPGTAVSINALLGGAVSSEYYNAIPGKASVARPDVAAAYPALGPNHGFDLTVAARPGRQTICVIAFDTDGNYYAATTIGCSTVTVN